MRRSWDDVVKDLQSRLADAKAAAHADEVDDLSLVLNAFQTAGFQDGFDGEVWNAIARRNLIDAAHCLLERGVRQKWQCDTEYDPIMEAVDADSIPMVELLLDHGWNLDHVVNVFAENAVTLAARNGNASMFSFLMGRGAALEQQYRDFELTTDPAGELATISSADVLQCAIEGGSQEIIQYVRSRCNRC